MRNERAKAISGKTRRTGRIVLVALVALTLCLVPAGAQADPFGQTKAGRATFSDHTVSTVSPSGTTINLFDYWDTEDNRAGGDFSGAYPAATIEGINTHSQLWFAHGSDGDAGRSINKWTKGASPLQGIVENELVDGYPVLQSGRENGYNDGGNPATRIQERSLSYLFDLNDVDTQGDAQVAGKKAYSNVSGLLQIDQDGYYYYNGEKNFASFDAGKNAFDVYDAPAVRVGGTSVSGQFFPFNTAADVFDPNSVDDPVLSMGQATSQAKALNHWFGMSMTTRFIQLDGGKTQAGRNVTYEFSGDDDVWVFIDGVLVGDLGGIHNEASLKIDFCTGKIFINGEFQGTLADKFREAGASLTGFTGDTFTNETPHTLKFFYLERGNSDSNMELKFNLVRVPESGIVKTSQTGRGVAGARFELYTADENYRIVGPALVSGETDERGNLMFVNGDGTFMRFEELSERNGNADHFVLRETYTPDGYRPTGDIFVRYDVKTGIVYSENYWDTGAFSFANEVVTAPNTMNVAKSWAQTQAYTQVLSARADRDGHYYLQVDGQKPGGFLFAVALHRDPGTNDWRAVYGNPAEGSWWVSPSTTAGYAGIIEAVRETQTNGSMEGVWRFAFDSSGGYVADITNLPGDASGYYYVNEDKVNADFALAIYYTSADDWRDISPDNLYLVESDSSNERRQFGRVYAATFFVPNMKNSIYVQKYDETGAIVSVESEEDKATFSLYREQDVAIDPQTGAAEVREGAVAVDTVQTRNLVKEIDGLDSRGTAYFRGLSEGSYYLVETEAPRGFALNPYAARVVVDDTGVYAYAGEEGKDDGISVARGAGSLVDPMKQFATNSNLDTTLNKLTGTLQIATGPELPADEAAWQTLPNGSAGITENPINLKFDEASSTVEYVRDDADPLKQRTNWVATEYGWARFSITQNAEGLGPLSTPLGDKDLTGLLSGTLFVGFSDRQAADLSISKTVKGYEGMADADAAALRQAKFPFTVSVLQSDGTTPLPSEYAIVDNLGVPVTDAQGRAVKLVNGTATFELSHGQTVTVKGLPTGVRYTVAEGALPEGVTCEGVVVDDSLGKAGSSSVDVAARTASGTLRDADGDPSTRTVCRVSFENAYRPEPAVVDWFGFEKELTYEDGRAGDAWAELPADAAFTFRLTAMHDVSTDANGAFLSSCPFPEGSEVKTDDTTSAHYRYTTKTITKDQGLAGETRSSFGPITFTAPGTYSYLVNEMAAPTELVSGVSYSKRVYRVWVTVEDDGRGSLTASAEMRKTFNQGGTAIPEADRPLIEDGCALFSNTYSDALVSVGPIATKLYRDGSGTNPLRLNKFTFMVKPVGPSAALAPVPVKDPTADNPEPLDKDEYGYYLTTNDGEGRISFGQATFTSAHEGQRFVYQVAERIPADAVAADGTGTLYGDDFAAFSAGTGALKSAYVKDGMTYDASVYYVHVEVSQEILDTEAGTKARMSVRMTHHIGIDPWSLVVVVNPRQGLTWKNEYQVDPVSATLRGTKHLLGREMAAGESYGFTLAPTGAETLSAVSAGKIAFDASAQDGGWDKDPARPEAPFSASASTAADGASSDAAFSFEELTFSRAGTYSFEIRERVPEDATNPLLGPGTLYRDATDEQKGFSGWMKDGVTYDTHAVRAQVVVEDAGGRLVIAQEASETAGILYRDSTDPAQAAFANSYEAKGSFALTGEKVLSGRAFAEGDEFSFSVEGAVISGSAAKAPLPSGVSSDGAATVRPRAGSAVEIDFGELAFDLTDAGTYAYTLREVVPDTAVNPAVGAGSVAYRDANPSERAQAGWTDDGIVYDPSTYRMVLSVSDEDCSGALRVAVDSLEKDGVPLDDPANQRMTWNNEYHAEGVAALGGTKVFSGRALDESDDDTVFTFVLTTTDDVALAAIEAGDVVLPADGDGDPAMTTIQVTGAQLRANYHEQTDSYEVPFSFGDVTVRKLPALRDGGYWYGFRIFEQGAGQTVDGITYDDAVYRARVKLTDDGRGSLVAEVVPVGSASINRWSNVYRISRDAEVEATVEATKVLLGKSWANETFDFSITAVGGLDADGNPLALGEVPLPALDVVRVGEADGVDAAGNDTAKVRFGPMTYRKAGSYAYEIRETIPGDAVNKAFPGVTYAQAGALERATAGWERGGILYDTRTARVVVRVSDNKAGGLAAVVETAGAGAVFENAYAASAFGNLLVEKTLFGRPATDGQFSFTVRAVGENAGAGAAKLGLDPTTLAKTVQTPAAGAGAPSAAVALSEGPIEFTSADAGATFAFEVAETAGGGFGYENDEVVRTVTFAPSYDAQSGAVSVTAKVTGAPGDAAAVREIVFTSADDEPCAVRLPFENAYAPAPSDAVTVSGAKELSGRPLSAGEFSFALDVLAVAGGIEPHRLQSDVRNDAEGAFAFDPLAFDKATLDALVANGHARSQVDPSTGNAAWTLTLRVSEQTDGLAEKGISVARGFFDATVSVTDDNAGKLSARILYPSDAEGGAVIRNVYAAHDVAVAPKGAKRLVGAAEGLTLPGIAGAFSFTIEPAGGSFVDESGTLRQIDPQAVPCPDPASRVVSNNAQGEVTFGEISFSLDMLEGARVEQDGSREKTFKYRVRESGQVPGVKNETDAAGAPAVKEFSYTLVDTGAGALVVRASGDEAALFTFENVYDPAEATGAVNVRKTLSGRELRAGEFAFELVSGAGSDQTVVSRASNDAAGRAVLGLPAFDAPGAYSFAVREVAGDAGGVSYDKTVYAVDVAVRDDGSGALSLTSVVRNADGTPADSGAVFVNEYRPTACSVQFGFVKTYAGAPLADGQFAFELVDAAGAVVQTAKNDARGAVQFAPLVYTARDLAGLVSSGKADAEAADAGTSAWTIRYSVREVDDGQEHVVYDDHEIAVTVRVEDTGAGALSATFFCDGPAQFDNAYKPPATPEEPDDPNGPGDPDGQSDPDDPAEGERPGYPEKPARPSDGATTPAATGDFGGRCAAMFAGIALIAVAVAAAAACRRRRRGSR